MNYLCPRCDQEVTVGSHCPRCSKPAKPKKSTSTRERKSWEKDSAYDGTDIPDDDFDYDEFIAKEFGKNPIHKSGLAWYWYLVAVFLLLSMAYGLFR
jgi:hypothetical protein